MAESTREAVRLNNLGAHSFAAGDLSQALNAFRMALTYVPANATHIEEDQQQQQQQQLPNPLTEIPSTLGISFLGASSDSGNVAASTVGGSYKSKEGLFAYDKPLVFNQDLPATNDGIAAFSAVVVFNIALAFDIKSRYDGNTKALQLYESCIDLFARMSERVDLTSAVAAACNNKGRIYFERGDFERSARERERLVELVARADQSPTKKQLLEDEDLHGMLLNLLIFRPPIIAPAA